MDPQLVALARHAETGVEPVVKVWLITSSGMFKGVPRSSKAFPESTEEPLTDSLAKGLVPGRQKPEARLPGRQNPEVLQVAQEKAAGMTQQALRPLRDAELNEEPSALTLAPAEWVAFASGATVELPAVRVQLASVEAWFLVMGKVTEAKQRGGWFAAIGVPMDFDN